MTATPANVTLAARVRPSTEVLAQEVGGEAVLLDLAGEQARPIVPVAEESLDESWAEPVVFDGCSVKGQGQPGQTQAIHVVQPLQPPRPSRATSAQANPQSGVVA